MQVSELNVLNSEYSKLKRFQDALEQIENTRASAIVSNVSNGLSRIDENTRKNVEEAAKAAILAVLEASCNDQKARLRNRYNLEV